MHHGILENRATCNTSVVSKRTFYIILNTHTTQYIHTTFLKLAFETSDVYSVVYVF